MRNISSQLAELHAYAFLIGYRSNQVRQAAVEDSGIPVRLIGVDRSGFHRSIGMFCDDVAAGFDIGAHQHRLELAGEPGGVTQDGQRLLRPHTNNDVASGVPSGHRRDCAPNTATS